MTDRSPVEETEVSYVLPPSLDASALARRYISDHCSALGEDLVFDAQLLVSELVTNAVKHGQPAITLHLRLVPPGIGVRVHDDGDMLPVYSGDAPPLDQGHGRGLRIVSSLATEWGVETTPGRPGKTVWFALRST